MKQTRYLSEFSCLSEYTRLYPICKRWHLLFADNLCKCSWNILSEFLKHESMNYPACKEKLISSLLQSECYQIDAYMHSKLAYEGRFLCS